MIEKILDLLHYRLDKVPRPFGVIHLFFLIVTLVFILLLIRFRKNQNSQRVDNFTGRIGLTLLFLEVIKQLLLYFEDGTNTFRWENFPLHFCSFPLYLCFIASLLPSGKSKKNLYAFLGCFGIIGGLSVVLTGGRVFSQLIWKDIHTLVWHSLMVLNSVYILLNYPFKEDHQELKGAIKILIMVIVIATLGNIIAFQLNPDTLVNYFNLSPYHGCDGYPVTGWIYNSRDALVLIQTGVGWFRWLVMMAIYTGLFIVLARTVFSLRMILFKVFNYQVNPKNYFVENKNLVTDILGEIIDELDSVGNEQSV